MPRSRFRTMRPHQLTPSSEHHAQSQSAPEPMVLNQSLERYQSAQQQIDSLLAQVSSSIARRLVGGSAR